jgi:ubiquinone/menaquinone biosynthesis C-methylase UbiE
MESVSQKQPSLENLVESEDLGCEILHPGGLEITSELATLCHIERGSKILDVAAGTGESACYLQENFGSQVVGIDASDHMVERARKKRAERALSVEFQRGDAHSLPFEANTFDAVISECTICILDKDRAIREMVRVAKPGGYVGIHDLCWKEGTSEHLKQRLVELEGERPETLNRWTRLFEKAGLEDVRAVDKSFLISTWTKSARKELGLIGQLKIVLKAIQNWGFRGFGRILESIRIFRNERTGYGIVVGRKPFAGAS